MRLAAYTLLGHAHAFRGNIMDDNELQKAKRLIVFVTIALAMMSLALLSYGATL